MLIVAATTLGTYDFYYTNKKRKEKLYPLKVWGFYDQCYVYFIINQQLFVWILKLLIKSFSFHFIDGLFGRLTVFSRWRWWNIDHRLSSYLIPSDLEYWFKYWNCLKCRERESPHIKKLVIWQSFLDLDLDLTNNCCRVWLFRWKFIFFYFNNFIRLYNGCWSTTRHTAIKLPRKRK